MSDKLREIVSNMTAGPWAYETCYGVATVTGPEEDIADAVNYLYNNNALGIVTLRNNADLLLDVIDAVRAYQKQRAEIVAASSDWCKSPSELQMDDALAALDAKIGETK